MKMFVGIYRLISNYRDVKHENFLHNIINDCLDIWRVYLDESISHTSILYANICFTSNLKTCGLLHTCSRNLLISLLSRAFYIQRLLHNTFNSWPINQSINQLIAKQRAQKYIINKNQ